MGKLIVSLSPHAHGTDTVEKNMYGVIIALIPALLVSFYFFGIGSAIVCATSDGSAILTGLLLGFNLPSNLPIWIIIIGALFAIGVAKMTFGGLGNNLFNPALVGRAALLVAFPAQMTTWPKVGQLTSYLDAETGATPLYIMKESIKHSCPHRSTSSWVTIPMVLVLWVRFVRWLCCWAWPTCFGRRSSHGTFPYRLSVRYSSLLP